MNYGYFKENFYPDLNLLDEKERFPIHLYHHVSTQISLKGLKVLEVGSGRGGGASYIARYLMPKILLELIYLLKLLTYVMNLIILKI